MREEGIDERIFMAVSHNLYFSRYGGNCGVRAVAEKNKDFLGEKYPAFIKPYKDFSTEGFALAVYKKNEAAPVI